MKKRLRKKHHRGEWQEWAFKVTFACAPDTDVPTFFVCADRFTDAIEAMGLRNWGWGKNPNYEACIFVADRYVSATEEHRTSLAAWLQQDPYVVTYNVGPLVDRFYDPSWTYSNLDVFLNNSGGGLPVA